MVEDARVSGTDEAWRLFVAVELGHAIQERIGRVTGQLSAAGWRARWVRPELSHVTLKFLGNVALDRLPALRGALSSAAEGIEPFQLTTGELGMFPNSRRPRVVWLGLRGDLDPMARIALAVDRVTSDLGFPPEERAFTPHITLGRVGPEDQQTITGVERTAGEIRALPSLTTTVARFVLMRSELRRNGPRYSVVQEFPLDGAAS